MSSNSVDEIKTLKQLLILRQQMKEKLSILKKSRHKVQAEPIFSLEKGSVEPDFNDNHVNYGDHEKEIERIINVTCTSNFIDITKPAEKVITEYGYHEAESECVVNAAFSTHQQVPELAVAPEVDLREDSSPFVDSGSEYVPSELESLSEDRHITTNDNLDISFSGDQNKGRKRKKVAVPGNWKRQKAKKLRMEGKEYTGFIRVNNKILQNQPRKAREMGSKCDMKMCSKSTKRECTKLLENDRISIFKMFWSELDWKQRNVFVINHIKEVTPIRRYTKHVPTRNKTIFYYLTVGVNKIQVCKKTFLNTIGLGEFTVRDWIEKNNNGMVQMKQPKHNTASNTNKRQFLTDYFASIPKLPSHYARKSNNKLFLQHDIKTHTQLYNMYKEFAVNAQKPEIIVSRKLFDEVFFENNLSIHTLKKDKCDLCEGYRNGNIEESLYSEHIIRKDLARKEKAQDKESALRKECTTLTVDLEALKLASFLQCSGFYYKTKLCCHNYTVYNLSTQHVKCYWFTECDTELNASTYASCLIDYLSEHCRQEKNKIIIYSDGCTYQNRNISLSNALLDYAIKNKIIIEQKYLEVGHTQMECDSVHAAIERKCKNREIHLPSEYITITKEARNKPFPYEVRYTEYSLFKNYADSKLYRYSSIRPGKKKGDPCVTDIKVLQYESSTGIIMVKLGFDKEFVNLPHRTKVIQAVEWPQLYFNKQKITLTKWRHLQELKFALPADTHSFYDNLPYEDS